MSIPFDQIVLFTMVKYISEFHWTSVAVLNIVLIWPLSLKILVGEVPTTFAVTRQRMDAA